MASPVGFGGLDINALVGALIDAQSGPIQRMQADVRDFRDRISALSDVSSAISSVDTARREELTREKLSAQTVSSNDEDRVTATADGTAQVGSHEIEITALAKSDRHKTQTVADRNETEISHGTLEFTVDGKTTTITVDDSNDTLQGIADAINAEDESGVHASIINDGTGDVLVMSSDETGLANDVTFDSNTTGLTFTQTQAAQDAAFVLDGISITSSTNTVTTALEGVTLQLQEAEVGKTVQLDVEVDTEAAEEAVQSFVDAFNNALSTIEEVTRVDASGQRNGGPLVGDTAMRSIKAELLSSVTGRIEPDSSSSFSLFAEVGVTLSESGRLSLNSSDLREALEEDPEKVANLFLTTGDTSDASVQYVTGSASTQAGSYAVQVDTLAEQAALLGDNDLTGGLAQDETLTLTIAGTEVFVPLVQSDQIGTIVQKINDALESEGVKATAVDEGGKLRVTTEAYGSDESISIRSSVGAIAGSVGFDLTDRTDDGVDVAGSIGGVAATGDGRLLVGGEGSDTDGLRLIISSSTTGDKGTITFRPGISERLERSIDAATDTVDGRIPTKRESLERLVEAREERIVRMEDLLLQRADSLRQKFAAAEQALQSLQGMQASLFGLT